MTLYITGDRPGQAYVAALVEHLTAMGQAETLEVLPLDGDDLARYGRLSQAVADDPESFGVIFEEFGMASFMVATKTKGLVAAPVSDERTAYMTREHNNSRLITVAPELVSIPQAMRIVLSFLASDYAGGRHQIRVDMLEAMC